MNIVPERLNKMKKSIQEGQINKMMKLMIKDSNQFHAVCLDTYPALLYLNDFSRNIINLITQVNKILPRKIGYTFDAGPHAVLVIPNSVYVDLFKLILNITKAPKER